MALILNEHDLSPEHRATLNRVREDQKAAEEARKPHVDKWNENFGLYLNYKRTAANYSSAGSENDRDEVRREAEREWGAELFIPYCFSTIETVVPRVLLNDPRMVAKPKTPGIQKDRLDAIQQLFAERQEQIGYALELQPTVRSGLKFGLGVQKTYWNHEVRPRIQLERGIFGGVKQREVEALIDDGPMAEAVDIFDFFWAPTAKNVKTCPYAIHRTWRPFSYIRAKVEAGRRGDPSGWFGDLDLDSLQRMGSSSARDEVWAERMQAAGLETSSTNQGRLYEIWEHHDGEFVNTVLNKQILVASRPTPFFHRELPFQIYRPTLKEHEFVGVSEIDPIKHLQYELNTLRSQRRDNATLVLQKAFMYAEGLVDPDDFVIGPAMGIPVSGGVIDDVLKPLNFGEIPASGYQEEEALKRDIELTSGISDPIAGGTGGGTEGSETATGIQLIQAAANVRITLKAKNLSEETIRPAAAQWLELYRQHMRESRPVRIEDPTADTGFDFVDVGREDIEADIEVVPAAGSTEPENTPQKRNDAMTVYNQFNGNPEVDQRQLVLWAFSEFDIPDPESFLMDKGPDLEGLLAQAVSADPKGVALALEDALEKAGIPEDEAQETVFAAIQRAVASIARQQTNGSVPVGAQQEAPE